MFSGRKSRQDHLQWLQEFQWRFKCLLYLDSQEHNWILHCERARARVHQWPDQLRLPVASIGARAPSQCFQEDKRSVESIQLLLSAPLQPQKLLCNKAFLQRELSEVRFEAIIISYIDPSATVSTHRVVRLKRTEIWEYSCLAVKVYVFICQCIWGYRCSWKTLWMCLSRKSAVLTLTSKCQQPMATLHTSENVWNYLLIQWNLQIIDT